MGILDDAIREHLELKRRLGADPEEVARLEDEAFGPPSRPGDPEFAEPEQRDQEGAVATEQGERPPPDEPQSEPEVSAEAPTAIEQAPPQEQEAPGPIFHDREAAEAPGPEGAAPETGEELELDLDLDAEAEPSTPAEDTAERPIESQETVEHQFEDAVEDTGEGEVVEGELTSEEDSAEKDAAEEDEDVLEETPEFLRDAPEDDELWFEQGEPKDFDF
ncbi:MAG TPA: hypothetical protein VK326_06865 [Solirubrobacterales bacterium]|nr:hypothetical protein [Solirubrobacterales bacterium]